MSVETKQNLIEKLRDASRACQEAQDEIDCLVTDLGKGGELPESDDLFQTIEAVILDDDAGYSRGYDKQDGGTSIMVFESISHPTIEIHVKHLG